MPLLRIRHLTRYTYREAVGFGEHRMMFDPCESRDQRILERRLDIHPAPSRLEDRHDVFGNSVRIAAFGARARSLSFESRVLLDHRPAAQGAFAADATCPPAYGAGDYPDLARSIERAHADPDRRIERWARRFADDSAAASLSALTRAIHREFAYAGRLTVGTQTPLETLALGSGSCRDFAVLMIDAVRCLGFAARFVSGYLHTPRSSTGRGGGHTHAWVRVFLPDHGWLDYDPTNGAVGGAGLIRVAVARDPAQALPLHGSWFGEAVDFLGMEVVVEVRRVDEPTPERRVSVAMAG